MTGTYSFSVSREVLGQFASLPGRQRSRLLQAFEALAETPFLPNDARQSDLSGRPLSVRRFGEWTLTWWVDHAAKQVHILAMEHLRY